MTHILVVDDDCDTRGALRFLLEYSGYTVAEAVDGAEGLAAIKASTVPLIVLLDFDIPKLNGVEVLQAVASDPRLASRHAFIMITAVATSRYKAAKEACATLSTPLVMKPFDVDSFLDQVASAARRLPTVEQP